MNKYLMIPVSLDYGAEEYIWKSQFTTVEELKAWWLSSFDLLEFESQVESRHEFEDVSYFSNFYDLIDNTGIHIVMIDACNSSYLRYENH